MIAHFYPFKRVFSAFVAIAAPFFISAQITPVLGALPSKQYTLTVTDEPGGIQIKADFTGYQYDAVQTPWGTQNIVKLGGGYPMLQKGMPDLYQLTLPVQIPNTGNTQVEYIDVRYTDVPNVDVAPSKGNLSRLVNPADVPVFKGTVYEQNVFWPANFAELDKPYVLRDARGQALHIHPFQYNAVTKTLRVITSITLKVAHIGGSGINELTSTQTHPDDEFSAIYRNHFVNFIKKEKAVPAPETGDLLIISHPAFISAMQPYINWKIRKGINAEIVSVASIGNNSAAIKAYIANYYASHNLSYVLLVGDLAQVASPTLSGGKSDPSYGFITGNDSYAEVIVGRFSAENVAHVNTQVSKVLAYEITPPTGNTRFSHTTHIASDQGPGDNNEMDWEHERVIRGKLTGFTYADYNEYYDSNHQSGGNDDAGDPGASAIVSEVNSGTGIINYTGHGSSISWGTSGFSNADIATLTNTRMWPFIWSVGCVNGEFDNGTCFGEAWLRATNNGQPVGAIATFMSSINQSWDPPMAGQDGMVDILVGNLNTAAQRSFGGISVNGCIYMNDVYDADGDEMTNTWHCFGDPTLIVRTANPQTLTATHNSTILIGSTQVIVNCNVEGALVAVSQSNTLLGKAFVNGGIATIDIEALNAPDTVFVTATAFNYTPYMGYMLPESDAGPYIALNSHNVNDAAGNNNAQADYSENDGIDISLKNIGNAPSGNLTVKLRSTNPYIIITDSIYTAASLAGQTISAVEPAFAITVAENVPDQEQAYFEVLITNGSSNWTNHFTITLNAPVLSVTSLAASETTGNGNNYLQAGETGALTFANLNSGHAAVQQAGTLLYGGDSYVTVTSNNIGSINAIGANATENATFDVALAANTPVNHYVPFEYTISSGSHIATYNTMLKVNMIVEDFETGNFNAHAWQSPNQVPWEIDPNIKYQGDYSMRSGAIGNSEMTIMQLSVNVINPDSIAFFRKVSSEEGYDMLRFTIDGDLYGSWSGLVDWGRVAYPMYAGPHTFMWIYNKDNVFSANDDAAWVDFIELPNSTDVTGITQTTTTTGLIKAYPNPGQGNVTLLVDTKTNTNAAIEVYNTQGQLVYSALLPAGQKQLTLNTANWAAGLYSVIAKSAKATLTTRLVVK